MRLGFAPDYVLDKMKMYEISAALKHGDYSMRESWEQTRWISFIIAQSNSRKRLKLEDIFKFPWDEETEVKESKPITENDVNRIKDIENRLINKGLV